MISKFAYPIFLFFACVSFAGAAPVSGHPTDPDFLRLADGRDLRSLSVMGESLKVQFGSGASFSAPQEMLFRRLKQESQQLEAYPIQWTLMDLAADRVVAKSAGSSRRFFGGSITKVYVAGAVLDKEHGAIKQPTLQSMAELLVFSSNSAWQLLQRALGGGNENNGRGEVHFFTQKMGYAMTRGFLGEWRGSWGILRGLTVTADDLAAFLRDSYLNRYEGAEIAWKLLFTSRTGADRAKKYLPTNLAVGGKTGTFDGTVADRDSGQSIRVSIRHHVIIFEVEGRPYGLAILSDGRSDEDVAALAHGLVQEVRRGN